MMLVCTPCSKSFTGIECLQQHLDSKNHKIKEQKYKLSTQGKIDGEDNSGATGISQSSSPNESSMANGFHRKLNINNLMSFICEHCDKVFNGETPYQMHLASEKHIKKVRLADNSLQMSCISTSVNEPVDKEISRPDEVDQSNGAMVECKALSSAYYCSACNKVCTGEIPFKEHIASSKHIKKQRQADRLKGGSSTEGSSSTLCNGSLEEDEDVEMDCDLKPVHVGVIYNLDNLDVTVFRPENKVTFIKEL